MTKTINQISHYNPPLAYLDFTHKPSLAVCLGMHVWETYSHQYACGFTQPGQVYSIYPTCHRYFLALITIAQVKQIVHIGKASSAARGKAIASVSFFFKLYYIHFSNSGLLIRFTSAKCIRKHVTIPVQPINLFLG